MITNLNFPPVYFRGEGIIAQIGEFCKQIGKKVLIIGGKKALNAINEELISSLVNSDLEITGIEWYGGECTWANIDKISKLISEKEAHILIAVGGGKALDTGKAAAYKSQVPCVTVPTIAATCAAYTPLSIIHDERGRYVENTPLATCPVGIFADSKVILNAPAKWLYAGMGDTLAKWYELRATTVKIPKTSWTIGGITNGKICYEIINEFGAGAKEALENGRITEALEYVIDAIIFYAGMSSVLGGEKCRGAASHSVYFGFTNIDEAHHKGHGLLVGFGNLVLLALEGRDDEEILKEIKLAKGCGVPVTLAEIASLGDEDLWIVARVAAEANDMKNMPVTVTPEMVYQAIRRIDDLGKRYFS